MHRTRPVGDRGRRLPFDVGDAEAATDTAFLEAVRDHERCERRELLAEGVELEDLASDVSMHSDELEALQAPEHRDRLGRSPRSQRETELRVLLPRHHILVRVRLDAGSHADQQARPGSRRLRRGARLGQLGQAIYLVEGVDHDPADTCGERGLELFVGLVVAVAHEALTGGPAGDRDGQLTAGRDVEGHALLERQRHHRLAQEGLRRIRDAGAEAGDRLAAPVAHMLFVVHEHGCPVLVRQPHEIDTADAQVTVFGDRGSVGEKPGVDRAFRRRSTRIRSSGSGHITSGAFTPSRPSPMARPMRTPSTSHSLAWVSSGGTSSPRTRQSW